VGTIPPSKVPAGVTKVYHVANGDKLSESVALAIQAAVQASGDTSVVMGASSKFGSTVIPRAAALLNASPITDILEIEDESKCYMYQYGLVLWCSWSFVVDWNHLFPERTCVFVCFRMIQHYLFIYFFRNFYSSHVCWKCSGKGRVKGLGTQGLEHSSNLV
jgi:hypothetical protein